MSGGIRFPDGKGAAGTSGFLYQENHAIVAWFYRSFSDVFRYKNS